MEYYQNFIKNEKLRRWVVLAFLIAVLYFVRSILPLMLLTFVFSYLAYRFVSFIERKIKLPGKISGFILYGVILFNLLRHYGIYSRTGQSAYAPHQCRK